MEPANLNPAPEPADDSKADAWYRANLAAAPLADDGFTDRVLAALPPAPQQAVLSRRLFCLTGALAGTAVAVSQLASFDFNTLVPVNLTMPAHLASPELALAVVLTAACLCYVFRPRLNFLPRF
jgi:hypothetical protein